MTVLAEPLVPPVETGDTRTRVAGKFLWRGSEKFWVKGVTYGTFGPNAAGEPFPERDRVQQDFASMRSAGVNSVRTYTVPPRWLLEEARVQSLAVLAGVPWEQHITFLDDRARTRAILGAARSRVADIAGHPALLGLAIGNEIPGEIVRWHGRRRVERFLERLQRAVREEDPDVPLTYVNYPTTEYLDLPFLDFLSFNVYLEDRERLEAYLARLQNLAEGRPLLLAEVGLDSQRNGLGVQASTLSWQIDTIFASGCVGNFVFAWTDEWHRGGAEIPDWDFGLTDRQRRPKPALEAVRAAYARAPFAPDVSLPRVTVAICTYNGSRTLAEALDGATTLDYPDYEVVVVDDGSTDATAEIASRYPVRLIRTANQGLSAARNEAWRAATGEIVAYTDDDARPDPHWLRYLASAFLNRDVAAVGGPNLAPNDDGWLATCVARSPGGPMHVLDDDTTAEHIPGCNSAFRRSVLQELGGFDPRFRVAGDDVDMCWRVQDAGYVIGFHPAAMVWHRRRGNVRTYWRQQRGYGKAEALLEAKWPARYNALGHLFWRGRIYGDGQVQALRLLPERVYHGTWGTAPFQALYGGGAGPLAYATMPEWYLLAALLTGLSVLGALWSPLLWAIPLLALTLALPVAQAVLGARGARFPDPARNPWEAARRRATVALLHLVHPLARLDGRLRHGLTPWRRRAPEGSGSARQKQQIWSERWREPAAWRQAILEALTSCGALARRGGDFDAWDVEVRGGLLGSARVHVAVEEHGQGQQLVRVRTRALSEPLAWVLTALALGLGGLALLDGAVVAGALLLALALACAWGMSTDRANAVAFVRQALRMVETAEPPTESPAYEVDGRTLGTEQA